MNHHHHTHGQVAASAPGQSLARFEFVDPTARNVSVAGCFNQWQPGANPLQPGEKGHWHSEIALPPGTYEYRFVVDGLWLADPAAVETVPNPFGGRNSIFKVVGTPETARPADSKAGPARNANPLKNRTA
jgi:1,4-alpha-glucan branching enzyme